MHSIRTLLSCVWCCPPSLSTCFSSHFVVFFFLFFSFFLALERCAGEVVTDILQIVETYDPDEAQMQLVMRGNSYFGCALTVFHCCRCCDSSDFSPNCFLQSFPLFWTIFDKSKTLTLRTHPSATRTGVCSWKAPRTSPTATNVASFTSCATFSKTATRATIRPSKMLCILCNFLCLFASYFREDWKVGKLLAVNDFYKYIQVGD